MSESHSKMPDWAFPPDVRVAEIPVVLPMVVAVAGHLTAAEADAIPNARTRPSKTGFNLDNLHIGFFLVVNRDSI